MAKINVKNRNIIELIEIWKILCTPNFKPVEFNGFKMGMKKIFALLVICFLITSCGVRKTISVIYQLPSTDEKVMIVNQGQELPKEIVFVGNLYLGDNGLTPTEKCTFEKLLDLAILETQKMGGNILYIKEHKLPYTGSYYEQSSCHSLNCDIYKNTK